MKRLVILTAAAAIMLSSCDIQPEAFFYADKLRAEIGEEVYFTNESYNASWVSWDFGDGTCSDAYNVVHTWSASGVYTVCLTTYSSTGSMDQAFLEVEIVSPTMLEIEVLEWYDEYPVQGASVILYPTLNDWDNETNALVEGFTNSAGKVVFTDLGPYVYFVDVWHSTHNNYTLRDEDAGFIRTPQLVSNSLNKFTAWVDFTGSKNTTVSRDRKQILPVKGRKYPSAETK
ncbi:MAG: PKD domain-containing protein [Bacteroidales bacterium]|jgi:hypothetical protein|nr:PKD domain-containing protein [Bacteroidales bacterium]